MKQKAFFIIFKGLSMKQVTQILVEGESPNLIDDGNSDQKSQRNKKCVIIRILTKQ